jgi:hypothetical protein
MHQNHEEQRIGFMQGSARPASVRIRRFLRNSYDAAAKIQRHWRSARAKRSLLLHYDMVRTTISFRNGRDPVALFEVNPGNHTTDNSGSKPQPSAQRFSPARVAAFLAQLRWWNTGGHVPNARIVTYQGARA